MNEPTVRPARTARRLAAGAGVPLAFALLVWSTDRAWRIRLPDPLPTHWNARGIVDGFTGYEATFWTILAFTLIGAAIGTTCALAMSSPARRLVVAATGGLAGTAAGSWCAIGLAALDSSQAAEARMSWQAALIAVCMLGGALTSQLLHGRVPIPPRSGATERVAMALDPHEQAVWTTTMFVPLFLLIAMLPLAAAIASIFLAPLWVPFLLAATAALTASFSTVRVTVDAGGLHVRFGPFGLPRKAIPLATISRADADDLHPLSWGGWGYRILPDRSAFILRSGPGLVVEQHNGRRFAITLDDPEPPAALLNTLVARRSPQR